MSEGTNTGVSQSVGLLSGEPSGFLLAAHELKSPLALIRQLALSVEDGSCSPAEVQRLSQQIRLTSERALRLTSDVTRSARQDTLFDVEPLNPVNICEEVAHELSPLYAAQNKSLQVIGRLHPPLMVGNRDLVRRILLNFGDNALHYTAAEDPVQFRVTSVVDKVRIGVRDHGPAVALDIWSNLMQRLQAQSAQPVSARPGSSGLGLYIAGQFALAMNGEIGATRHRDGATFYVDLAASQQLRFL